MLRVGEMEERELGDRAGWGELRHWLCGGAADGRGRGNTGPTSRRARAGKRGALA